jgi:cation diffusion facilitator family transporter
MLWIRKIKPDPTSKRLYRNALVITVTGNVLLAITKAIVALLSGSVAIYADAANSASDVLYSIMMVLGLWMAQRPPDLSHPQGHSRFEPMVGMVITLSMALAGFEAGRAAVERYFSGAVAVDPGLPTLVLVLSAGLKAGMFFAIRKISSQLSSPTLATTAVDNLSDVLTSLAAFIGVLGSQWLNPIADPLAGLLVAAWIFRAVIRAGKENFDFLTGAGASEELREEIARVAGSVPGVERVHHTMTEYAGPRLVVDLHVNVDGNISLNNAHAIEDEIVQRLESLPEIDRAYVHVEPKGFD